MILSLAIVLAWAGSFLVAGRDNISDPSTGNELTKFWWSPRRVRGIRLYDGYLIYFDSTITDDGCADWVEHGGAPGPWVGHWLPYAERDGRDWWVVLPLWMPFLLVAIPTVIFWWRDRRRIPPGHCQKCGYNLTGNLSGVCPECGEPT